MTCPVTTATNRKGDKPIPCDRPVTRYGLCGTHADDHDRLCGGCAKCAAVVWTCPRCDQDHWHGAPEDGCDACGAEA